MLGSQTQNVNPKPNLLAGLASFMVTLMFSSWIRFHQQQGRNAIVMTCVLAIGLVYIIGVNLRWWHTFIPAAQHKVSPAGLTGGWEATTANLPCHQLS